MEEPSTPAPEPEKVSYFEPHDPLKVELFIKNKQKENEELSNLNPMLPTFYPPDLTETQPQDEDDEQFHPRRVFIHIKRTIKIPSEQMFGNENNFGDNINVPSLFDSEPFNMPFSNENKNESEDNGPEQSGVVNGVSKMMDVVRNFLNKGASTSTDDGSFHVRKVFLIHRNNDGVTPPTVEDLTDKFLNEKTESNETMSPSNTAVENYPSPSLDDSSSPLGRVMDMIKSIQPPSLPSGRVRIFYFKKLADNNDTSDDKENKEKSLNEMMSPIDTAFTKPVEQSSSDDAVSGNNSDEKTFKELFPNRYRELHPIKEGETLTKKEEAKKEEVKKDEAKKETASATTA